MDDLKMNEMAVNADSNYTDEKLSITNIVTAFTW